MVWPYFSSTSINLTIPWCFYCKKRSKSVAIFQFVVPGVIIHQPICFDCMRERGYQFSLSYKECLAFKVDFILKVGRIQRLWKKAVLRVRAARIIHRACHNWLYKPITADGQYGIQLKIGLRQLEAANTV